MRIVVFTLFPEAVSSYCTTSILGRAQESGALEVGVHDLRDGSLDARRTVDDSPFGGGAGMVLMPEPVFAAVEAVERQGALPRPLYLLDPGGRVLGMVTSYLEGGQLLNFAISARNLKDVQGVPMSVACVSEPTMKAGLALRAEAYQSSLPGTVIG